MRHCLSALFPRLWICGLRYCPGLPSTPSYHVKLGRGGLQLGPLGPQERSAWGLSLVRVREVFGGVALVRPTFPTGSRVGGLRLSQTARAQLFLPPPIIGFQIGGAF